MDLFGLLRQTGLVLQPSFRLEFLRIRTPDRFGTIDSAYGHDDR